MKLLPLFFLVATISTSAFGQADKPDLAKLPPGPLIQKRAPDFSKWTIVSSFDSQRSSETRNGTTTADQNTTEAKRSSISTTVMVKTGKIMLRQVITSGNSTDTWCINDVQTTVMPDGKNAIVQERSTNAEVAAANYEDYSQTDFPGFEWISEKNYAGIKNIKGKPCIWFRDNVILNGALVASPVEAFINLDSRFPVAFRGGGQTRIYEFDVPPTTALSPPTLVRQLLANRQKLIDSSVRRVPNP